LDCAVARIEALEGDCKNKDDVIDRLNARLAAAERRAETERQWAEKRDADFASAVRREGEAVTLLRELEWALKGKLGGYCPVCEFHKDHGHAPDCRLAAALGKGEGK
jgi:hypothetical protein